MLGSDLRRDLEQAAVEAGGMAINLFRRDAFETKPDGSLVTEADRRIEERLRQRLSGILPGAAFLGEESVSSSVIDAASEWIWAVDPIDGTSAYTDGLPTYCVSIGLLRFGVPFAGVVIAPAIGKLYSAVKGEGATANGQAIAVRAEMPTKDLRTLYVPSNIHRRWNITHRGKIRSLGSTALHVVMVAAGSGLGAIGLGRIWDFAGAAVILAEAGGTLRTLDGAEPDWKISLTGVHAFALLAAPRFAWTELASSIERRPRTTFSPTS